MSDYRRKWSETDYPNMSWHDNHVHGIEIRSGEHGTGGLLLDLDYILEWLPPVDGVFRFFIAPATLLFRDVTDLRLSIDYASETAAITPFSIGDIGKAEQIYPNGYKTFRWSININWPIGEITFIASGYEQKLCTDPIITFEQYLTRSQRRGQTKDA